MTTVEKEEENQEDEESDEDKPMQEANESEWDLSSSLPNKQSSMLPSHRALNDEVFLTLIVTFCLPRASSEQKQSCCASLLKQLETLQENMMSDLSPSLEETVLALPFHSQEPQQPSSMTNCLRLRLPLLVALLPTLASMANSPSTADIPERLATVLLTFTTKTLVQQTELGLFLPLLNALQVLIQETGNILKEKVKKTYQNLAPQLPSSIKNQIEQTLPFARLKAPGPNLNVMVPEPRGVPGQGQLGPSSPPFVPFMPTPSVGQKRTIEKTLDPWTLLEDFPDAPPSPPSHLSAERVERENLLYSNPLLKRRKIHN